MKMKQIYEEDNYILYRSEEKVGRRFNPKTGASEDFYNYFICEEDDDGVEHKISIFSGPAVNDIKTKEDIEAFKKSSLYRRFMNDIEYYEVTKERDFNYGSFARNFHEETPEERAERERRRKEAEEKQRQKEAEFVKAHSKSNTLVFHMTDPTTVMLKQVYAGRGWDVINTTNLSRESIKQLMLSHERIVCLGHGTSWGLVGGMITGREAPYFKGKKVFAIWCNADRYFIENDIGQGQFITGNMPSEVWECRAAGCGRISKELMLENIKYWSKLCAEHVEQCLEGDVEAAVRDIRLKYLEKYGNHPVTIYNAERTQPLGVKIPLPAYTFQGEPLSEADMPGSDFDEEKFLAKHQKGGK